MLSPHNIPPIIATQIQSTMLVPNGRIMSDLFA
jgi:hypothetical protein